jgi:hypothetical protein
MQDMGVMSELEGAGEVHYADAGGFVSPSGLSYIGSFRTVQQNVPPQSHISSISPNNAALQECSRYWPPI